MAPRFAIVGDNTVDRYLGTQERDFVGGNALNVAAQLALAGAEVAYFGAIGEDEEGEYVRATLAELGIESGGLVTSSGRTALTRIRVDSTGERTFESEEFGVTDDYFPSETHLDEMARADWVQLGMVRRAPELRRLLSERSVTTIGQDCAVAEGYSSLAVAFSSGGGEDPWPVARAARAGGAQLAVVTRGPLGAFALGGLGDSFEVAAEPVEVVDTTGAGDSFIAGFISVYAEVADTAAALTTGAQWAAAACGHYGGFPQSEMRVG